MGKLRDQTIATLFGGVSRQPDTVRRPGQVERADNTLLSVVTGGFEKRPATQTIAKLSGVNAAVDYAVHAIDRDPTEQSIILLAAGSLLAYNGITGAAKTVTIGDTKHYFLIEIAGINSTGIVTNNDSATSEQLAFDSGETTFDWTFTLSDGATVFKVEGSVDGSVWNDIATGKTGTSGTFSTTIGAVAAGDHNYIRANITSAAGTATDTITLAATFKDKTYLLGADPEEFAFVSVADFTFISNRTKKTRLAEAGSGTITSTVQKFADLPSAIGSGNVHRVQGVDTDGFGTFFVKDDAATSTWIETVDPNAHNDFDTSRMPHQLVRNADGTFTFQAASWNSRAVGDESIVVPPSFVGKAVEDVLFFRNRLAFLADENAYLSRSGDALNMWPEKAVENLATDPIDRAASTTKVTILKWGAVFRKLLFATAQTAQFELSGGDAGLTPDNASLDLTTSFTASGNAKPEPMGDVLYFPSTNLTGSVIYEYFFEESSLANTAADVTKHVPDYIPTEVLRMAADTTSGTVFFLSSGESNSVFVYKTFFDGTQKVQSAWSRYQFGATAAAAFIHGMAVLSGFLVLVVERQDGGIYLEQMPIAREAVDTNLGFIPLLDQRSVPTGVYDASNDCSTWTTPYEHTDDAAVILSGVFSTPGRQLSVFYPDKYKLTLSTVLAGETIVLGGLTFTAHATTTTTANREFSIAGSDIADAGELTTVINDATDGVPGVTATDNGDATITLNVDDACDGSIAAPTGTAITNATITATEVNDLVAARGDFSAGKSYVGRPYTMTVELSKIYWRDQGDQGPAVINGRLQIRDIRFAHEDTGYYKVQVTPKARTAFSREFTGRVLGDADNKVGVAAIDDAGSFVAPVLTNGATAKIEIINDKPIPCVITSASWRGFFNEITRQG